MTMRVETGRDSSGRLDNLKIFKGRQRRPVELQFIYGTDGFVRDISFTGTKADLPSVPEIVDLINEKFIERIGVISKVELIDLISLITEITIIKTIETITDIKKIRSIESADIRTGLIRNPSFETGDLNGWRVLKTGTYDVTDTMAFGSPLDGKYVLRLQATNPATGDQPTIGQDLPIISTDDVEYISFNWIGQTSRKLSIDITYSDGWISTFTFVGTGEWKRAYVPASWLIAGKYVKTVAFHPFAESPLNDGRNFYVDLVDAFRVGLVRLSGEIGTVQHFSLTATGDIRVPTTNKNLKILDFFYYSTVAGVTELRFKTTGNVVGGLPDKGACGFNKVRAACPKGALNEIFEGYLSGAGVMKGYFTYIEV